MPFHGPAQQVQNFTFVKIFSSSDEVLIFNICHKDALFCCNYCCHFGRAETCKTSWKSLDTRGCTCDRDIYILWYLHPCQATFTMDSSVFCCCVPSYVCDICQMLLISIVDFTHYRPSLLSECVELLTASFSCSLCSLTLEYLFVKNKTEQQQN